MNSDFNSKIHSINRKIGAKRSFSVSGLTYFRDESDSSVVFRLKECYEFFNPGKSAEGQKRMLTSMKPYRQLKISG